MSNPSPQEISCLIDGAMEPAGLSQHIDGLVKDDDLRGSWARYHLIGHTLRGEPVRAEYEAIAPRVAARLRDEPTLLAPVRARRGLRVEPVLAYALAAGAALVAVFALPPLFEDRPTPGAQLAAQPMPPAGLGGSESVVRWSEGRPAVERQLTRYLVNHQEYAPAGGIKGVLPYATFVGYEGRR